ncbi:LigA [Chthoniobacter flavus Ellin428]|uniref:LigA n=1 Tax=Chthoniobacter flavus Ellin428 TaxID=497964 RepID=B4CYH1_9BACT|nr:LigA [Chthoniobacter flavus Ellin428]
MSLRSSIAVSGVVSAGLRMQQLPAARPGASFQAAHEQRIIPRDDLSAHADRFANDHGLDRRVAHFVGLSERLGNEARVVTEARGGIGDVELRLAQRLAVVARFQPGEVFGQPVNEVGKLEEITGALGGAHLRPRAGVEGLARMADGEFGVVLAAIGYYREQLIVRGIENFARVAFLGLDPRAVEEHRERFHHRGAFSLKLALAGGERKSKIGSRRWQIELRIPISNLPDPIFEPTPCRSSRTRRARGRRLH